MSSLNSDFTVCQLPENVLKEGIDNLQERLREEIKTIEKDKNDLLFLNSIIDNELLCGRFVWYNTGNVDKALHQVIETSKWRRSFGVTEIKRSDLQMHIVKDGVFYPSKFDVNGDRIVYMIVKEHFKNSDRNPDNKNTYIFCKEKLFTKYPGQKVTLVVNCNSAGLANADIGLMLFIVELLLKYYPNILGTALVYDMPWIFNVFWNMIKVLLPKHYREKVKFVNKDSILEYVSKENLPKSMGGDDSDECDYELLDFLCENQRPV